MKTKEEAQALAAENAKRRHEHEAEGAVAGAIAGAVMGAIAGPPGAAAGAVIGGLVGAVATGVVEKQAEARALHDEELDEEIGVMGGEIGAPNLKHPPTAVEAYAVDLNRYPPAAGSYDLPFAMGTSTMATMATYISPTYIKSVPRADGWNSWFIYTTDTTGSAYIFASGGKDGTVTVSAVGSPKGPTTDFNADIVYSNGSFLQWPEGVQR